MSSPHPVPKKALLLTVLKHLGHKTPSEAELNEALRCAFADIKRENGVDPDAVKYKLSLVPVEREWVKTTFR